MHKNIATCIKTGLDEADGSREVLQKILIVGIICIYREMLILAESVFDLSGI